MNAYTITICETKFMCKKKIKTKKVHEEYKKKNYEENTGQLQFKLTYPVFL